VEAISMNTSPYPVRVDAQLDPNLSRWLWLVKWLLVIPHYVVLAFLWLAFVVLSLVALVAIVITGRYPRAIFDFNVGVLRWTWRVDYYAYSALGTDHYPPFTLEERPDYPAHLEIDYPEHLSRGLALVKWWLLALPHYLVVGLFVSGLAYAYGAGSDSARVMSFGLIGILVLIAGVALLFTGRYPTSVYDLVLGLNRWVLRVAAYAGLMTDVYPPFRLDQGGTDPARLVTREALGSPGAGGTSRSGVTAPDPTAERPPTGPAPAWTAGRVIAVVLGSLLLLGAIGTGLGAGATAIARAARDSQGYLMSPTRALTTDTYALVTESAEITTDPGADQVPHALLGDARITATGAGAPVFVGLARTAAVDAYLGDTARATVTNVASDRPAYRDSGSAAPATPPAASDIWVVQAAGSGTQEIVWPVESGEWTLVVMNADGSAGVDARLAVGATVPALDWLLPGLLVATGLLLVLAIPCFVVALRPQRR
jgi:hypothetical protein